MKKHLKKSDNAGVFSECNLTVF